MNPLPLLAIFRDRTSVIIALLSGGILFLFDYRLMKTLPSAGKFSCLIGGALTPFNVSFSLVLSLLMGTMIAGVVQLFTQKKQEGAFATTSLLGIGTTVGFFTTFCTACTLPVLSLFGLSLGLGFFTTYNVLFKSVSLALLLVGLFLLNQQMRGACQRCVVPAARTRSPKTRSR
jgi:hypothetical protein